MRFAYVSGSAVLCIVPLPEGATLRNVSVDTLKREGKRGNLTILELSARRRGITRREALKQL